MIKRDNHYVPRMYLKNWATNKKVWTYTLLVPHENFPVWDSRSIKGLAYQDNLYVRVRGKDECDDFEVDFDSRFESPAAKALEKLSKGQRLSASEWKVISEYISAQYVRTPSFYLSLQSSPQLFKTPLIEASKSLSSITDIPHKSSFDNTSNELIPLQMTILQSSKGQPQAAIEMVVGKSLWLFFINHSLRENSIFLQSMRQMKWSIVSPPDDKTWPTSDNPVAVVKIVGKGQLSLIHRHLYGISNRDAMIVFPVSPKILLLGKPINRYDYQITADYELYASIKKIIIENALLQVYSFDVDYSISEMRKRTVNNSEFRRVHNEFDTWYDSYKRNEAPFLSHRLSYSEPMTQSNVNENVKEQR